MLSLLLHLVLLNNAPMHISETELYQVMRPDEVFVQPNGEVYVLNFEEARVQHYGADGKLKGHIGSKGKGPGEFTFPDYITLVGNQLFIHDVLTDLVSIFSLDGNFVRSVRLPERGMNLQRTTGGWFYYHRNQEDLKGSSAVLKWSGNHFESQKKITDIKNTGWGRGTSVNTDGTNTRATFSPLTVTPRMITSPDGSRFYFADALQFKIDVYDGKTAKHLMTITTSEKRIPFDETWADEQYQERTERTRKRNPGVKIQKLYPKYFPAIRTLTFDPEGNLVVDRWRGRPDDNNYPIAFDKAGKEIPLKYSWEVMRRLAGTAQGHAYLLMFEEESEAGLAKVALAQAEQFVKDNPITDWSRSRSISINN